ncbi:hemin receptor [Adhaeribacter aerolatus]|uniref:Hemin receptor n=2 Tax=Adhaeribacter aerolatus TaxID=670289 RepID=A0A512AUF7_9BACT|nr:hemin receptor [Adhaeribacter aerolatus]
MAQNENDALRYSRLGISGTARVQGIGGSQAALGADAGNLAGNPAGLGLYRRSEFTFSPGIQFGNTKSTVDGASSVDQRQNLNLGQLGVVFGRRKSDGTEGAWRGGSFGIGFARQQSFHNKFNYQRAASGATIVESLAESANKFGIGQTNFENREGLAYETYLINYDEDAKEYYATNRLGVVQQSEDVLSQGAQNQWDFAYGASYRDKLFLGASIGLSTMRYNQVSTFKESENNSTTVFHNLTLRDEFTTTGNGINGRLGIIFKPNDLLRVGASFQTPTYYAMNDSYQTSLQVQEHESHNVSTDPGEYSYNLTTPMRLNGGVAFILGKNGFISGDLEYVDYSKARLNDETDSGEFRDENNKISTLFKPAVNFKVGAEGRFDIFRLRAGYALMGDPYENSAFDRKQSFITAGAGIRQSGYFLDVALVNSSANSVYSPYTLNNVSEQPVVNTKNRFNNLLFTVGLNF